MSGGPRTCISKQGSPKSPNSTAPPTHSIFKYVEYVKSYVIQSIVNRLICSLRLRMSAAAVQTRLASLSVNKDSLPPLKPPIPSTVVKELLEKNDTEHDIYFGKEHFHNHFPHTLLSQFALGAPESRLKQEWDNETFNPLPKKQSTEISDQNWKDHIGVDKFYPNYLEFFKDQISKNGAPKTVLSYALDPTALPSFVSGAVHPLIHTGFGIEFGVNDVVAEGLAEMCVHSPAFAPVVDSPLYSKPATGKKTALAIAKEIHNDQIFENAVNFKDFPKSTALLKSKPACDAIKNYVMQWKIDESPEGFARAYYELFELTTHFTFSSAFPPPHIINDPKFKGKTLRPLLDFFLV
jgi:hypothetical protein